MCYTSNIMEKQYSSKEVAQQLGYSTARILMICKNLSLPRVGNQYVLGQKEIDMIKGAVGHKPTGRPRKHGA